MGRTTPCPGPGPRDPSGARSASMARIMSPLTVIIIHTTHQTTPHHTTQTSTRPVYVCLDKGRNVPSHTRLSGISTSSVMQQIVNIAWRDDGGVGDEGW